MRSFWNLSDRGRPSTLWVELLSFVGPNLFACSRRLSRASARSRRVSWSHTPRGRGAFTSDCWRTLKPRESWGRSRQTWSAGAAWVGSEVLVRFPRNQGSGRAQSYLPWLHFMSPSTSQSSNTINRPVLTVLHRPNHVKVSCLNTHYHYRGPGPLTATYASLNLLKQNWSLYSTNEWCVVNCRSRLGSHTSGNITWTIEASVWIWVPVKGIGSMLFQWKWKNAWIILLTCIIIWFTAIN